MRYESAAICVTTTVVVVSNLKKMKKTPLLLIFAFLFSCAQNPKLGKDKINFKKFSLKIDVHAFYEEQIEIYKKIMASYDQGNTDESYLNTLLENYKSVERIDTLHTANNEYLLLYEMQGMETKDTLATFGAIKFEQLDMISNNEHEFQSLRAISFSYKDNRKNFEMLKRELAIEYGSPEIIKTSEREVYKWVDENFITLITLDIEKEDDVEAYYNAVYFLINRKKSDKLKISFPNISGYWNIDWGLVL